MYIDRQRKVFEVNFQDWKTLLDQQVRSVILSSRTFGISMSHDFLQFVEITSVRFHKTSNENAQLVMDTGHYEMLQLPVL